MSSNRLFARYLNDGSGPASLDSIVEGMRQVAAEYKNASSGRVSVAPRSRLGVAVKAPMAAPVFNVLIDPRLQFETDNKYLDAESVNKTMRAAMTDPDTRRRIRDILADDANAPVIDRTLEMLKFMSKRANVKLRPILSGIHKAMFGRGAIVDIPIPNAENDKNGRIASALDKKAAQILKTATESVDIRDYVGVKSLYIVDTYRAEQGPINKSPLFYWSLRLILYLLKDVRVKLAPNIWAAACCTIAEVVALYLWSRTAFGFALVAYSLMSETISLPLPDPYVLGRNLYGDYYENSGDDANNDDVVNYDGSDDNENDDNDENNENNDVAKYDDIKHCCSLVTTKLASVIRWLKRAGSRTSAATSYQQWSSNFDHRNNFPILVTSILDYDQDDDYYNPFDWVLPHITDNIVRSTSTCTLTCTCTCTCTCTSTRSSLIDVLARNRPGKRPLSEMDPFTVYRNCNERMRSFRTYGSIACLSKHRRAFASSTPAQFTYDNTYTFEAFDLQWKLEYALRTVRQASATVHERLRKTRIPPDATMGIDIVCGGDVGPEVYPIAASLLVAVESAGQALYAPNAGVCTVPVTKFLNPPGAILDTGAGWASPAYRDRTQNILSSTLSNRSADLTIVGTRVIGMPGAGATEVLFGERNNILLSNPFAMVEDGELVTAELSMTFQDFRQTLVILNTRANIARALPADHGIDFTSCTCVSCGVVNSAVQAVLNAPLFVPDAYEDGCPWPVPNFAANNAVYELSKQPNVLRSARFIRYLAVNGHIPTFPICPVCLPSDFVSVWRCYSNRTANEFSLYRRAKPLLTRLLYDNRTNRSVKNLYVVRTPTLANGGIASDIETTTKYFGDAIRAGFAGDPTRASFAGDNDPTYPGNYDPDYEPDNDDTATIKLEPDRQTILAGLEKDTHFVHMREWADMLTMGNCTGKENLFYSVCAVQRRNYSYVRLI